MRRLRTGSLTACLALAAYGLMMGTKSAAPTPPASAEADGTAGGTWCEPPGPSADPSLVGSLLPASLVEVVEVVDVDHLLDPPPQPTADPPAEPDPPAAPPAREAPPPPTLPARIPPALD